MVGIGRGGEGRGDEVEPEGVDDDEDCLFMGWDECAWGRRGGRITGVDVGESETSEEESLGEEVETGEMKAGDPEQEESRQRMSLVAVERSS